MRRDSISIAKRLRETVVAHVVEGPPRETDAAVVDVK
jgi:hypothetical protein